MGVTGEDDWEEVNNSRAIALAEVFGPADGMVFHAPHPFALGGNADVLGFYGHLPGAVYATAELTGKPQSSYADYELMICHRDKSDWGANIISRLAPYTQQAYIGSYETMDIDEATPADSQIKALIFDTYATFRMFDHEFEVRLCLGITKRELQFKMAHDGEQLIALLKRHQVYPYTDLKRDSIPLE